MSNFRVLKSIFTTSFKETVLVCVQFQKQLLKQICTGWNDGEKSAPQTFTSILVGTQSNVIAEETTWRKDNKTVGLFW